MDLQLKITWSAIFHAKKSWPLLVLWEAGKSSVCSKATWPALSCTTGFAGIKLQPLQSFIFKMTKPGKLQDAGVPIEAPRYLDISAGTKKNKKTKLKINVASWNSGNLVGKQTYIRRQHGCATFSTWVTVDQRLAVCRLTSDVTDGSK